MGPEKIHSHKVVRDPVVKNILKHPPKLMNLHNLSQKKETW